MPSWLKVLACRIQGLLARPRIGKDFEQELDAHLEMLTEENIRRGLAPKEACRMAQLRLGGTAQLQEADREQWGFPWLDALAQDIRHSLRLLRKNGGFTTVALLTLALGIGANTALFSVLNAVLITPLPYPQPDRLVTVTGYYPKGALASFQTDSRTMDVASFTSNSGVSVMRQGVADRLEGSEVSANFFRVLGTEKELGRAFQPGEDEPGRDRVVILADGLWRNGFGANRSVLGRIRLSQVVEPHRRCVSGRSRFKGRERDGIELCSSESALGPEDRRSGPAGDRRDAAHYSISLPSTQHWIPARFDSRDPFDVWNTNFRPLIARLLPRTSLVAARDELHPLIARAIDLFPYPMARNWNADATVIPLQQDLVSGTRTRLIVLDCAVWL